MSYLIKLITTLSDRKSHGPVLVLAILSLGTNMFTYFGTRFFTTGLTHHNLSLPIDNEIPLVSWTFIIYLGCYAYWIANYILGSLQDRETVARYWLADLLAKLVCLGFYIFYPTTIVRPELQFGDFWDNTIIWLYHIDSPDNLFPSIHCLTSWFCVIAVRNQKDIHRWYKVLSVIFALAVCVSTLTTKQHVIVDTFAGVFLAEFSYWFVKKSGLANPYLRFATALDNMFFRKKRLVRLVYNILVIKD